MVSYQRPPVLASSCALRRPVVESAMKVTDQTFICSKHFTASDFITERRDSNTTRSTKKKDTELKYRFLKDDAYRTIYPNCPQYLSQKKPASRQSLGSTAAREFTIAKREEEKKALELEKDGVKSINDVKDKLRVQEYINSPSMKNASIKIETSQVVFYELDVRDIKPSVKYPFPAHCGACTIK